MSGRRIWVAGHKGMVGSAVARQLRSSGDTVIIVDRSVVDLRNQMSVELWLKQNRPDAIIFAAAKVGGILANDSFPADFIYDNLAIETNVIHSAHAAGVNKLVFLGYTNPLPGLYGEIKRRADLAGVFFTGPPSFNQRGSAQTEQRISRAALPVHYPGCLRAR